MIVNQNLFNDARIKGTPILAKDIYDQYKGNVQWLGEHEATKFVAETHRRLK